MYSKTFYRETGGMLQGGNVSWALSEMHISHVAMQVLNLTECHICFLCFCRACTAQGDNICTLQSRPWSQHHSCTLLFGMLSCLCFVVVVTICKTASAACTCNDLLLEHLWHSREGRSLLKHNSIKWHYLWCLVIEMI